MQPSLVLRCIFAISILCGSFGLANGQECGPPNLKLTTKGYNIFSPEQETILGDLTYQKLSGDLRFVKSPDLEAYINRIGERLIKHLPPTGLRFQFFIVDLPEANAFNVPGGYVFVSRKLIAFAQSEDELAGVLGHELGHAVVHQGAIDFSDQLKKVLNVTELGDRRDIAEKYNLLIERRNTRGSSRKSGEESEAQQIADRVGLYATIAAGYDPEAFAAFFDRLAETKGKTGTWLSDLFGTINPEQKRLREMIKITNDLPAACRDHRDANAADKFLTWQAQVVSYRRTGGGEELPGLVWKKELSPKLRSDLFHFSFTEDGKYFLAQDEFAVAVVQRDPLQVLFQIPTEDAEPATFTPDGQFVVFGTENLRLEKWSIADQRPVTIRELVVRRDCWEHQFSPDGRYLACVDYSLNLSVLDTSSGKKIFQKQDFYRLSAFEFLAWIVQRGKNSLSDLFNIQFTPDSRFLMVARSQRFRARLRVNALAIDQSEDTTIALDLNELKPITIGGDLKKVASRAFTFLDSHRILGMYSSNLEESGTFSFPDGKRLDKFPLAAQELVRTANPNLVIVKPLENAKLGVVDLSKHALVAAMNKADVSIWRDQAVYEGASGKVLLANIQYDPNKKALQSSNLVPLDIPATALSGLYTSEISDNMQWLGVSSKSRGAIWDLRSGERKLFTRGFRGLLLADDGRAVAEFPKQEPQPHTLALMNAPAGASSMMREIPERGADQFGRFVLLRKSLKATEAKAPGETASDKKSSDKDANKKPDADPNSNDANERLPLTREVRFELHDAVNDRVVWSREFPREAPNFFFDQFSGRLIFFWRLSSEVGKNRLKEDQALAARAKDLSNVADDYLAEVVDAFASKTVGTLLIDTGKGSFGLRWGISDGDYLVLHDSENRVLVYSLKSGDLQYRFFGTRAALNPSKPQVVVENYPGELTFYDLSSGEPQFHLGFASDAAFVRFSLDGKKFFVLSKSQTAYAFDLDRIASTATSTARE